MLFLFSQGQDMQNNGEDTGEINAILCERSSVFITPDITCVWLQVLPDYLFTFCIKLTAFPNQFITG
jgi:hypothetical protein